MIREVRKSYFVEGLNVIGHYLLDGGIILPFGSDGELISEENLNPPIFGESPLHALQVEAYNKIREAMLNELDEIVHSMPMEMIDIVKLDSEEEVKVDEPPEPDKIEEVVEKPPRKRRNVTRKAKRTKK